MPNIEPQQSNGWLHRPFKLVRRRPHFSTAAGLFLAIFAALIGAGVGFARGVLLAFDASALTFLATIAWMFAHSPPATIRAQVAKQDAGRWGVLASGVVVASVAVVSLGIELHASNAGGVTQIIMAAASLVLSWCFLNTMFALHYAHEYYSGAGKDKAFAFPGADEPDYWDFTYFAFVLGMTFQVSDVAIMQRGPRRVALVHGIVAFFFDVFILALSVNAVAGKF
jgi:uncharacterized membrane protein